MSEGPPSPLRRKPPEAIPLTLLTGFLGAGKTTLLNTLVRSPAFARSVVIINEFGEIAIDHLLVEQADGDLLTLSSGCVCCAVRGDLVAMLEDLLRARDNDRMAPFDRVVIETSGLAEPGPILDAVGRHPYLALRYRIDGVITLVDTVHGLASLAAHHEAVDQVAMADVLVLTKTDLGQDEPALRARLATLNPTAVRLDAAKGEASAGALLAAVIPGGPTTPTGHDHHHHHHHDDVVSGVLVADAPLAAAAVSMFLDLLRARHGAHLLRAKGLLAIDDDPARPLVIQMVRDTVHPPRRLAAWPDGVTTSRLVVIGRALDLADVERLWAAFFGPPAIDQPDAAALTTVRSGGPGLF